MSTTKDYLLDTTTIDYIRLATFDFERYCKISAALRRRYGGWRATKWLQYRMEESTGTDRIRYGIGMQGKRQHGIFEASGVEAHILATWFFNTQQLDSERIYCTRIDLQLTVRHDARPEYLKIHKRLPGPKRIIIDDTGTTLYSGNRTSDSFYRLYDKTERDIRLEIELKGKQAKIAWDRYMMTGEVSPIYQTYLRRTKLPKIVTQHYENGDDLADLKLLPERQVDDLTKKVDWLKSLDSLVHKLLNDHDTRDETHALISRWYDFATKD